MFSKNLCKKQKYRVYFLSHLLFLGHIYLSIGLWKLYDILSYYFSHGQPIDSNSSLAVVKQNSEWLGLAVVEGLEKIIDFGSEKNYVDVQYRKYTFEEIVEATDNFSDALKIGEGGYGPVYKCNLDHTLVAVKTLRSDVTQGMKQFIQEVNFSLTIVWFLLYYLQSMSC